MDALTRWDPLRWDPFRELEDINDRFSRIVGRLPARRGESGRETMTVVDWIPTVDVAEDEREFLIKAELPEVEKKDVKVTVQDGVLALAGERKFEKEEKGKKFHRVERAFGTFSRTFELPIDANTMKITAEFKDGLLKVHLPKSEDAKPRSVDVKIG